MSADKSLAVTLRVEQIIVTVRGQRVILDSDLAAIYGVTTKVLNQAVRRNADRFPADFVFRLTLEEVADLRSQFVTSSVQPLVTQGENRFHMGRFGAPQKTVRPFAMCIVTKGRGIRRPRGMLGHPNLPSLDSVAYLLQDGRKGTSDWSGKSRTKPTCA